MNRGHDGLEVCHYGSEAFIGKKLLPPRSQEYAPKKALSSLREGEKAHLTLSDLLVATHHYDDGSCRGRTSFLSWGPFWIIKRSMARAGSAPFIFIVKSANSNFEI